MRLTSVYDDFNFAAMVLFRLLQLRKPEESISHKVLPSFEDHCAFVLSRPYEAWYLIETEGGIVRGAVYLSKQREIGVSIMPGVRGQGYGVAACQELMRLHPGRFLWNVNPANAASIALAQKLGFAGPIQHTYERAA